MVDGIKLKYIISDYDSWSKSHGLQFRYEFDKESGEIYMTKSKRTGSLITKSRSNFQGYSLELTEVTDQNFENKVCYLVVHGSLHKNYFYGENIQNFAKFQMLEEIANISDGLALNSSYAKICNIEIGINISMPISPILFLDSSLLSYKGKRFEKYAVDNGGKSIGYHCKLGQYSVKVYDKGLQYGLECNLMRIEARFIKMEAIGRITGDTLATLKSLEKEDVKSIISDLWDGVLINELVNAPDSIKDSEIYLQATNFHFMKSLQKSDRRRHDYIRSKFKALCAFYGDGMHALVKGNIINEVERL